jgi:glycosyltransferase involved in cell wall biosynthesis/predicted  nucleic acid-binding Zn-ribbon protein
MTIRQRLHILHISDGNRGGSQRHIVDLCRTGREDLRHFILRVAPESIGLFDVDGDRLLSLDPDRLPGGWPAWLPELIGELGIGCIHAHALAPLIAAFEATGSLPDLPCVLTLHDLRAIDPDFFDAPRADPVPNPEWIARCRPIVDHAAAVIVPSEWLASILRAQYPDASLQVIENGIGAPPDVELCVSPPWSSQCTYAVVGAVGPHKGSQTLTRVANAIRGAGIVGVLIGYTDAQTEPGWLVPGKLYVHGRYRHDELSGLLEAYRCQIAYFPNLVPESFSYVLSEVWQAGVPALAPDVGALGERVKASGAGWLLDDPQDAAAAAAMIDELLAPAGSSKLAAARGNLAAHPGAIPALADTRAKVEAIYCRHGVASSTDADAGWTRLAYRTRTAQFEGIDDSLLDVQWLSLARGEHSLREWNAKLTRDVTALDANARRMQSHFEECVARARRLDADVRQLKDRNAMIEADAAALRKRSGELEAVILEITARNHALDSDVVAIGSRNAGLEQHVIALRERNLRVEGDVRALIGRNAQLEGDVVALTQRNIELDADVVALKERNTLVEAALAAIKQRNTRVEFDAAALASELGSTRERLAAIEAELASGRARAAELERALGVLPSTVQTWLLRHAR